jgi:hypothetical protein
MAWKVLERVGLPIHEEREVWPGIKAQVPTGESTYKEPGESITKAEFDKHQQSAEQIQSLIDVGAIEEA